ncbi:uncharacterized membrane protein YbhN (UPF0104 family) [Microbacteriaceae bacterium SG_E_30_P1]|uniref:Uncharacterized membrane protein YbhN (UPF0104 family) n=1 Tax=Antiquaquibacter oligotrophicus TaxID=2880260 RepID=A0ABT6KRE0_9MICO|nr:lysylphosphatidylglycerol synthase transmembrane domain-containing protein [Antiquaquibacter oligotrophicus]MDH6182549.1 uncharacterized membrane protein YbhN (UPF0104 family) [Antiquaquibacter oligotrophicus]UDF14484.1 flippase-like domain-containing protein [Antiquaquibacter oligotrophicus]
MTDAAEHAGDKPVSRTRAHLFTALRYIALAVVIGFAVAFFAERWTQITDVISRIPVWGVVASFLVMLLGMVANVLSWVTILNGLGHVVPLPRGSQIMLVGQLGKYVPGSVWGYVMQMELGRQYGIARARVLVTTLYAAGIGVVASLILGVSVIPSVAADQPALAWLYLLLPIGLVCLHPRVMTWLSNLTLKVFRRPPLEHRVRYGTIAIAMGWSLLSYVLYGVHLHLLVGEVLPWSFITILMLGGAISLGFTASLVAPILPSGAGIRELVLILVMLAVSVPDAYAQAASLLSRAMFTAGDLLLAGAAVIVVLIMRRSLRARDVASNEYAQLGDWHSADEPPTGPHPARD